MIIDVKIIDNDNNELDLLLQDNDIVIDNTGESLITQRLFSKPNWLQSDAGSKFEEIADNIITSSTRSNVQAVLDTIVQEISPDFKQLKMMASLQNNSIVVDASWDDHVVKYK